MLTMWEKGFGGRMSDGVKTDRCRHSKKPVWDGGSGTYGKACQVAWPSFTQDQRDRFIEMYLQYHGLRGYRHG
jgi:hypothetical protein